MQCGSCVIFTCGGRLLSAAAVCLCSRLRQSVPAAWLSLPVGGESRMDVIFDVNVRTTEGERWSIDMQLEVQPSPCSPHLDVDLTTSQ